jgi:hypothetical protein
VTERAALATVFRIMARKSLLLCVLLAACSKGPQADLRYIKEARSAAAEWALVNEQASRGRLTGVYAASMRKWLRDDLQTAASSLNRPDTRYAFEIDALLKQPDDAAPEELRAHAERLKQIEDSLESA